MKTILLVGAGGALGSVCRYLISLSFAHSNFITIIRIPIATLICNIIGALVIGVVAHWVSQTNNPIYFLLVTGFCGGFTTFSAFSLELFTFLKSGDITIAFLYITASILLTLFFVWLGFVLTKIFI